VISKVLIAFAALALTSGGAASSPERSALLDRLFDVQANQSERGCCVIPGAANKCVYANAAFCGAQAAKANLPYEFHPNVSCSSLPQCR
jgi:hypothetical protein